MNNIAICVICKTPSGIWYDFLSKFSKYDTYIAIDDNSQTYTSPYENVKFIQYDDAQVRSLGYKDLVTMTIPRDVSAWDKAVYHFAAVNTQYEHVWFLEDDVFFYNENTIKNIDDQYPNSDLLTETFSVNPFGRKDYWFWNRINIEIKPPYVQTMACATRASQKLLLKIKEYAEKHKTLFYLEALFSTLCFVNKLVYDKPKELNTIRWGCMWKVPEMNRVNIFHPVKDLTTHALCRIERFKFM
jgi:hypothetical protein